MLKSENEKQCYIKCWKCPPCSVLSLNTEGQPEHFLSCTLPMSWTWFTRWDIVSLFGTGELGNVSLNPFWQSKNEMPGSVWQWTLVALVRKKHPCTSTIERHMMDWHKQVTTWRALMGSCIVNVVCLLIESNCIELQPSINILICVVWLFDHSVYYFHKKSIFLISLGQG
jgi:hypothetical protein